MLIVWAFAIFTRPDLVVGYIGKLGLFLLRKLYAFS